MTNRKRSGKKQGAGPSGTAAGSAGPRPQGTSSGGQTTAKADSAADKVLSRPDWPLLLKPHPVYKGTLKQNKLESTIRIPSAKSKKGTKLVSKRMKGLCALGELLPTWEHPVTKIRIFDLWDNEEDGCSSKRPGDPPKQASETLGKLVFGPLVDDKRTLSPVNTDGDPNASLLQRYDFVTQQWKLPLFHHSIRDVSITDTPLSAEDMHILSMWLGDCPSLFMLDLGCVCDKGYFHADVWLRFGKAVSSSNIRYLDVSCNFGTPPQLGALLEHLDPAPHLHTLVLDGLVPANRFFGNITFADTPEEIAAREKGFVVQLARFIRRSVPDQDARGVEGRPPYRGASNLGHLILTQNCFAKASQEILATALCGSSAQEFERGVNFVWSKSQDELVGMTVSEMAEQPIEPFCLPECRSLLELHLEDRDDVQRPTVKYTRADIQSIFLHPFARLGKHSRMEELATAKEQAALFYEMLNGGLEPGPLTKIDMRTTCNEGVASAHRAAYNVLAAGRIMLCNVSPHKGAVIGKVHWLNLPSVIRRRILGHLDVFFVLSSQQMAAVMSFAADRRTIGFGTLNEVLLADKRLGDEAAMQMAANDGSPGSGHALVDVRPWKWAECPVAPYDWPSEANCPQIPIYCPPIPQPTAPQRAFLAATDCLVFRRSGHGRTLESQLRAAVALVTQVRKRKPDARGMEDLDEVDLLRYGVALGLDAHYQAPIVHVDLSDLMHAL